VAAVWISAGKVPAPRPILLEPGDFNAIFTAGERRFPARVAKFFFGSVFFKFIYYPLAAILYFNFLYQ